LRRRDLHPHQVHIAAEGETEKIVCERVLEALAGMPLKDTGVSVQRLFGVGNATLQQETLQDLKAFPRYLILIADNEGDMKRQVERLQEEGVLTDETTFLWDTSFEERTSPTMSWSAMIAAIGADRGAIMTLDATTLRTSMKPTATRPATRRRDWRPSRSTSQGGPITAASSPPRPSWPSGWPT
jgi:OLD-like protein